MALRDKETEITIRAATPTDAALLTEIGARTFYDTFSSQNTQENMSRYLTAAFSVQKQTSELLDGSRRVLFALVGEDTVGYAMLRVGSMSPTLPEQTRVELVRLYAERAWQGRGVGAALMQACLDTARQLGGQTLWLGVWEHNPRARAFYERWGFRTVGSHVFPLGDDPQIDLIMERPLV